MSNRTHYRALFKEYPDVVNVRQVSQMLGTSTKSVYKILQKNEIPAIKTGRAYCIPKVNVIRYVMGAQKRTL